MTGISANKGIPLLAAVALLGACSKETPIVETRGECGSMYQAEVCTWVRMRGDSVIDLGALVPISSIESAPQEGEMTWPPKPVAALALPPAAQQAAGFTHLTIFWEAMGHPPGPYLTPHFSLRPIHGTGRVVYNLQTLGPITTQRRGAARQRGRKVGTPFAGWRKSRCSVSKAKRHW